MGSGEWVFSGKMLKSAFFDIEMGKKWMETDVFEGI
jgi:hypothetical protein